ncbi:hypothetical protein G6L37_05040 [Agrobacterium rubi]|nr:hypothetical protein [Agrobacterium rubi]NTF24721.1 hypothetical protein [Agrobacterium rubi]
MSLRSYLPADADHNHARLRGSEHVIPDGMYCYSRDTSRGSREGGRLPIVPCPYWGMDPDRNIQDNGYCAHLKSGDWQSEGLSLLWDQVKECGVKDELPEEGD